MNVLLRYCFYLFFILTVGCNGSLSDEQRKALREEMEDREIKKVNENDIFRKALEIGREYSSQEYPDASEARVFTASLQDSTRLNEIEKRVMMAYAFAPDPSAVEDNIQKQGLDSLIYSTYILSSDSIGHVLFVKIARAKVVLAL